MPEKLEEKDTQQAAAIPREGGGPVKNTAMPRGRGELSEFQAHVPKPNLSGSITIPIKATPTVIASLAGDRALSIDDVTDRVWLTAVLGWQAVANGPGCRVDVLFKFYRQFPDTDPKVIYSLRSSAEASGADFHSTTLNHVDLTPLQGRRSCEVSYFLTAELPLPGSAANVVGPITFTGAEIEKNRTPLFRASD